MKTLLLCKAYFSLMLIMLFLFNMPVNSLQAQNILSKVSGKVLNDSSIALEGVTVTIKNTSKATATDASGSFTLNNVNANAVLSFSYQGYEQQEVRLEGKTVINVQLKTIANDLGDVIVVGYGTQQKVNLTGSVLSVAGGDLAKRPVMRASAALEGLAPGVTVSQTSGQPGADGGTIRIRGIGTLNDADPLVLIDGIEGALDGVDPNDIENISVLKDAASAAIYGSRGANGVILITTKRGNSESLKVNYNAYAGWQKFTNLPEFSNGYTYMTALNQAYTNEGRDVLYSDAYLQEYLENKDTDPDHYPDVDWQKTVYFGSGFLQHHYLSVTGGSRMLKIMGSVAYQDQKGVVPHYESERYSFRLNAEMSVLKNLQLKIYLSGRHSPTYSPNESGDTRIIYRVNHTPPIYPAILTNGKYGVGWTGTNPLAFAKEGGINQTNYEYLQSTFQVNYQIFPGADIGLNFTPQYNDAWAKNFAKAVETYSPDGDEPAYTVPSKSSLTEEDSRTWQNTLQLLFKYHKSFRKHNLNFLAGYEQISYKNDYFSAYRDTYTFTEYQELDAGSTENWQNSGTASEWALRSYFGRLNYDFAGKYLFEANLRRDGSSRFAEGNRYGNFPSFSAGWRISEEKFMKNIGWLSNLKLRASWGKLGNQEIGTYPTASVINLGTNYIFGGAVASGASQDDMANKDLSWESSTTKDIGIDIGLFQNKVSAGLDYYIRNTTDILLELPVSSTTGLNAPYQNAGSVKNTGWDIQVNYNDNIGKLHYNIGFNLSDVKNEVTDLKGTGPYISSYSIVQEGLPINSLYGYKAIGLFQSEDEVTASPVQFGVNAPGDIKYEDVNGDDVINSDDRQLLGNQIPRYTYGLNLMLNYKGFDLYLLVQGIGKRSVLLYNDAVWAFYNSGPIQKWQLDYWTADNPDAKYPRLIAESSGNNFQYSSWWVYNAAYARLKNLQIGYSLPKSWVTKHSFSKIRVYLAGDNLLTLNHMPKGWDPERSSGDATYYPISSTYTFGIDITF
ncbi:SusC/RagA family TonB-linked outer membrane protein [Parafilimonas sp.]|uniref:SusC/RagA family TonB-linked outer membrane protein n=1 Tax=Parafilimonas sp. TaxID=1969739 RepID=UPI0039E354AB